MRTVAEFVDSEVALSAHKALVDEGIPPEEIEIRSSYPLPEDAVPLHKGHPVRMWACVKIMWFFGAAFGASLAAFTQLDWKLPTSGHPLVSIPIDVIITYECAMLTSLIMTLLFFFLETRRYRKLCPAKEEDLPIADGHVSIIVDGVSGEKAGKILQSKGAKALVNLGLVFALLFFLPGCAVKMRTQPIIKGTETSAVGQPFGTAAMPEKDEHIYVAPLGYSVNQEARKLEKRRLMTPDEFKVLSNPVAKDEVSVKRGGELFAEQCSFCHGKGAKGDGAVADVFVPTPPDLTSDRVAGMPDGEVFFRITMGPGTMPSFANRLTVKERFDIVNFLRSLRGK